MSTRFDGRTAIVTGAGSGLGRAYALALAGRGANVVVNDLGAGDGAGPAESANAVVETIKASGGKAIAVGADVASYAQVEAMAQRALETWGRIDILISNAGVMKKCAFGDFSLEDFKRVIDVQMWGAVHACKAVWRTMCDQRYGRIVLTTSSAGLFGSEANSPYCTAKAAMVGLMNALHIDGASYNIRVNAIAPNAATNMNAGLLPDVLLPLLAPESVATGVLHLVGEDAPQKTILAAGAGFFTTDVIVESAGVYLPAKDRTPENIAGRFADIINLNSTRAFSSALEQTKRIVQTAADAEGLNINAFG